MELARKILFYFFLVTYLAVCPLLILYSFGYIYQPGQKEVAHTGVVYLSSLPEGADIYLEKSRFRRCTPASIPELIPGAYTVSVKAKGYRTWVHTVTVEPGKALAFDPIVLFPRDPLKERLSPQTGYKELVDVGATGYFLIRRGPRFKDISVYDSRKNTLMPLLTSSQDPRSDDSVNRIFTQEGSGFVLLSCGLFWHKRYFLADLSAEREGITEITGLLSEVPRSLRWNRDSAKDIFALYDDRVDRLDLRTMSFSPSYIENVKGFGVWKEGIFILDNDNVISKRRFDRGEQTVLFEDRHLGKDLFARSRFYEIKEFGQKRLLFLGEKGDLITTLPPYYIFKEGVVGIKYDEENNILLVWTKDSIWRADFNSKDEHELLFRNLLQLEKIYGGANHLRNCFSVVRGNHVLFRDRNDLFFLELMPDGKNHSRFIARLKDKSGIFPDEKSGFIYYLDPKGVFNRLAILPKEGLSLESFIAKEEL